MVLSDGYYGLTMDRLSAACECPKGTLYKHFSCKEDVILVLALSSLERQLGMMRRALSWEGRSRERLTAIGEAVALFARLHPDDMAIIHIAGGALREKGGEQRVRSVIRIEHDMVDLLRHLLLDAVAAQDLTLTYPSMVEEITLAVWALFDGGLRLMEEGLPRLALNMEYPIHSLWLAYNRLADAYGWRPFFDEWDYEETLAEVRRTVFPEESMQIYGPDGWYGDAGNVHPRESRFWPERQE